MSETIEPRGRRLGLVVLPAALLLLATAGGCRPIPRGAPVPSPAMILCIEDCASTDDVLVTYLGVGGFMIQAGDDVLLTAPHFTNPPVRQVAPRLFGRGPELTPDTALVRRLLPGAAAKATALLVGHGHYDHLLDVPFIATELASRAVVYGGPSVTNMLSGEPRLSGQLVPIAGADAGTVARTGKWFTSDDGRFRFMALASSHAPAHRGWFRRFDFSPGTVDTAMRRLPQTASEWRVGETYAYLIDVLDPAGSTAFRIYYQDTASEAPLGLPPADLGGRRVDLAILTVASATKARPVAPDALVAALKPRYVIASHWEWFFTQQTETIRRSPASDFSRFAASMKDNLPGDADWSMPHPMTTYRFRLRR